MNSEEYIEFVKGLIANHENNDYADLMNQWENLLMNYVEAVDLTNASRRNQLYDMTMGMFNDFMNYGIIEAEEYGEYTDKMFMIINDMN
jgi:hypothetical protein